MSPPGDSKRVTSLLQLIQIASENTLNIIIVNIAYATYKTFDKWGGLEENQNINRKTVEQVANAKCWMMT